MPNQMFNLFIPIFILFGVAMLLIYTISPIEMTKIAAQWNLLLVGVIGSGIIFYMQKKKNNFLYYFDILSAKDFFNKFLSNKNKTQTT